MLSERIMKVNRYVLLSDCCCKSKRILNSDLQSRLDATEAVLSQAANPSDLRSMIDEKIAYTELEAKIRQYEDIFGNLSEKSELVAQLRAKTEAFKKCQHALESREQVRQ